MRISSHRDDIDGLRSIAVGSVVLNHAGVLLFGGGFVGVDVFFVISGFLITGILLKNSRQGAGFFVHFYERRARRILPALFVMLAFCLVAGFFTLSPHAFRKLSVSAIYTIFFSSNFYFLHAASDYFAQKSDFEFLLHTWSLAVEEQFYIVFPLIIFLFRNSGRRALFICIAVMSAASFAGSIWATGTFPDANFYLAPTRAWELGLGAMLAFVPAGAPRTLWRDQAASMLGLLAIVTAVVLYSSETPFPGLAAVLPCAGAAAILWSDGQRTIVGRVLATRPMVGIGLISYSLYLWHWPIFVLFRMEAGSIVLSVGAGAAAIALSLVCAWASWRFVEQPFRARAGGSFSRTDIFRLAAAATAIGVGSFGIVIAFDGLPRRMSSDVRAQYVASGELGALEASCTVATVAPARCRLGAAAPAAHASVLLWGDSHAAAVAPGLNKFMKSRGLTGIAAYRAGCVPLLGTMRRDVGDGILCARFNNAVFEMLRQRDDLDTVVLVGRWALAAEGQRLAAEGGRPLVLRRVDDKTSNQDPVLDFRVFEAALTETVQAIRATGRTVIIVEGTPEIGWDVPVALGNHSHFGAHVPAAPTRAEIDARNARANRVIQRVAQQDGVSMLSLVPALCAPVCEVEHDGRPLYSDDDHLSRYGAETFAAPMFAAAPARWANVAEAP